MLGDMLTDSSNGRVPLTGLDLLYIHTLWSSVLRVVYQHHDKRAAKNWRRGHEISLCNAQEPWLLNQRCRNVSRNSDVDWFLGSSEPVVEHVGLERPSAEWSW